MVGLFLEGRKALPGAKMGESSRLFNFSQATVHSLNKFPVNDNNNVLYITCISEQVHL